MTTATLLKRRETPLPIKPSLAAPTTVGVGGVPEEVEDEWAGVWGGGLGRGRRSSQRTMYEGKVNSRRRGSILGGIVLGGSVLGSQAGVVIAWLYSNLGRIEVR